MNALTERTTDTLQVVWSLVLPSLQSPHLQESKENRVLVKWLVILIITLGIRGIALSGLLPALNVRIPKNGGCDLVSTVLPTADTCREEVWAGLLPLGTCPPPGLS